MPDPISEKGLQGRIERAIRAAYPSCWMFHPVGHPWQESGVPDLLLCVAGRFIGIEVKWVRPGESRESALARVTPQQHWHLSRITAAGGIAAAVTSVAEALALIEEGLRDERDDHQA